MLFKLERCGCSYSQYVGGRGTRISVSSRPAWSTDPVPEQTERATQANLVLDEGKKIKEVENIIQGEHLVCDCSQHRIGL